MHDIDQKSKYIESIEPIDLREIGDDSQNVDNMKLRAICKTSSFDTDSIVNSLHEINETSTKQILSDYHYTDNYNSEITPANRNINCADWYDGVCGWSFTHPYPYFVNYTNLLTKKKNRKYDVEFDESIGMFVPNAENLLLQQDTTTTTNAEQTSNTSNPHYMKEINRNSRIQSNAGLYSNVVYDSKYQKRSGSANPKPISYNNNTNNQQDQPNPDLSASDNGGLGGRHSVGQPQIFPFGSNPNTKNNSAIDSKRPSYNQDMLNNEQESYQLRKDKTSISDPPPVDSATLSKQIFQNITQERFNHIKRTFNVLINKGGSINGITGNDLRLKRAELLNARLNGEEFANIFDENSRPPIPQSNHDSRNNNTPVLPPPTQKLYSFYRSDSEMSAYNKLNMNRAATLKQQTSDNNLSTNSSTNGSSLQYNRNISVNQINAQLQNYTTKASKNNNNNNPNLLLDGESVVFGDNSFTNQTNNNNNNFASLYNVAKRKPEDFNDIKLRINNYNANKLIANQQQQQQQQQQQHQQQSAPLLQAQQYKFNDTKSNKSTNAAELSILSNQTIIPFSDQSVLPPIISGKRINLPHGPHRYL